MDTLNSGQREVVYKILSTTDNYFITGSAGVGKSYLLKVLVQELCEKYNDISRIAITAMTGIAAVTIDGNTLHSFAGLGHDGSRKPSPDAIKRWGRTKVLIIDQVSMLTDTFLDKLYKYILLYKIQVICFGDFFQLPPIGGEPPFMSKNWAKLKLDKNTVVLTEVVRQKNKDFVKVLNEIRTGDISEESIKYLTDLDISNADEIKENVTKLYTVNRGVDAENLRRLEDLEAPEVILKCEDTVTLNKIRMSNCIMGREPILSKMIEKEAQSSIQIKVGALVMLTRNRPECTLVNGSIGTVLSIANGVPNVEFLRPERDDKITTSIDRIEYDIKYKNYKVTRKQFPLKLAWSLSIHRCQGLTLKDVLLNVQSSFETGQIYTGVSRVTESSGLIIDDVETLVHRNKVCKKAKAYYKKFGKKQMTLTNFFN
jgi:ATP-dependent exoDNAse (exonuclease V) alpha subunit